MPQQPAITGDLQLDSWALQVTQELNDVQSVQTRRIPVISEGPELPGTGQSGDRHYLTVIVGMMAVGWYTFSNAAGWEAG